MKILVTGASGLLGNNVLRQLIGRGDCVRALVRKPPARPQVFRGLSNVEMVSGDILNPESLTAAVRNIDGVIHCAGMVHIGRQRAHELGQVNVVGTANLLAAVRKSNVRLVYISSIDIIGDPRTLPSNYARTKRLADDHVCEAMQQDANVSVVRPGFMLGPYDWKPSSGRLLIDIVQGLVRFAPPGNNVVCDSRTVARWCLYALDAPQPDVYQPGGTLIDYFDLFKLISQVTGCRPPFCAIGRRSLLLAGYVGDLISCFRADETELNSVAARGAALRRTPDQWMRSHALQIANRPLAVTIFQTWKWFCANGYLPSPPTSSENPQKVSTAPKHVAA